MRRQVKYAKLHGGDAFIPGIGGLGSTLPPQSKTLNLKMFIDSDFPTVLLVEINGQDHFVPLANIQIGSLYPEETKAAAAPKVKSA